MAGAVQGQTLKEVVCLILEHEAELNAAGYDRLGSSEGCYRLEDNYNNIL